MEQKAPANTRQYIRLMAQRMVKKERNRRKAAARTVQPQQYPMNRATRRGMIQDGLTVAESKTMSFQEATRHLAQKALESALHNKDANVAV